MPTLLLFITYRPFSHTGTLPSLFLSDTIPLSPSVSLSYTHTQTLALTHMQHSSIFFSFLSVFSLCFGFFLISCCFRFEEKTTRSEDRLWEFARGHEMVMQALEVCISSRPRKRKTKRKSGYQPVFPIFIFSVSHKASYLLELGRSQVFALESLPFALRNLRDTVWRPLEVGKKEVGEESKSSPDSGRQPRSGQIDRRSVPTRKRKNRAFAQEGRKNDLDSSPTSFRPDFERSPDSIFFQAKK